MARRRECFDPTPATPYPARPPFVSSSCVQLLVGSHPGPRAASLSITITVMESITTSFIGRLCSYGHGCAMSRLGAMFWLWIMVPICTMPCWGLYRGYGLWSPGFLEGSNSGRKYNLHDTHLPSSIPTTSDLGLTDLTVRWRRDRRSGGAFWCVEDAW